MIYRYHHTTGGWRFVVLFHEGRKHLKCLDLSLLSIYTLPAQERKRLIPFPAKPKACARQVKTIRNRMKAHGLSYSKQAVRKTLSVLEGA